jgi:hypothetical protein
VGGLKPPPAGRLRRANNPSSPVQHRLKKLAYHAPFSVRDTRGPRLRLLIVPTSSQGCPCTGINAPTACAAPRSLLHACAEAASGPIPSAVAILAATTMAFTIIANVPLSVISGGLDDLTRSIQDAWSICRLVSCDPTRFRHYACAA